MKKSTRWSDKCPITRRFDSKALHLAQAVWLGLGSNTSLSLLGKSLRGEWRAILDSSLDPSAYSNAEEFRNDYLAVSLMSKFPCFELDIDRQAEALRRFYEAELQCTATAKRLGKSYVNGLYSRITPESILWTARGKIARLLGPFSWDLAELFFGFGPGATYTRSHREGDAYYKFRSKPDVTLGCAALAYTVLRRVPRWLQHVVSLTGKSEDEIEEMPLSERLVTLFDIVPGNRIHFVPKDAKKDRTIAIEPTMNGYIQHGIGSLIRRRLRRVGIDLNDQSLNQELARLGSIDGSLATIDLSSASDSVALRLCEELLPPDWYEAICLCRSPVGILPSGEIISYQKVSSMGNGCTFELESLIFWAVAQSCVSLLMSKEHRVGVYGDDIIVPSWASGTVLWMLNYIGFSPNVDKTFTDGPFRESCGKHYFLGTDVTPLYIREDVDSNLRLIWFCNQVKRWSKLSYGLDPTLKIAYDLGVSMLPRSLQQPSISDGYGDFGLFGDLVEVQPRRAKDGHEGFLGRVWLPFERVVTRADVPYLLRSLSSAECWRDSVQLIVEFMRGHDGRSRRKLRLRERSFGVLSRDRLPQWRRVNVPVAEWSCSGPWLED